MEKSVVTFGEIMLRLSPPGYQRLIQADSLEVTYGGGESNVAVSLANYGVKSCFVTRLPDNLLGRAAANHLRRFGVNVDHIQWGGERLGLYFTETGASQRASLVVYDRAHSAISEVTAGTIPWPEIFRGQDWFHVTGITPALGDGPAAVTLEAVKAAKEQGLTVSCDLNFRRKLWTPEQANRVMSGLMPYVDIAVGNEEDAEQVFGIRAEGSDLAAGQLDQGGYHQVAKQLRERFQLRAVAITLRQSYSASDNGWSALLYDGTEYYQSRDYRVHIVDRIGGGDSFCGGLIYAFLAGFKPQQAVEFAAAASCLKHTIPGDFNHVTLEEVTALVNGDGSGRVRR
jgi:2-dehydro-3-deoxygluconokinase